MKEVLQFAGGRLSPAVAEDLADLLELLHDKEVRRYLCDDSLLPREAVAEMLTQSAQLDSRGLGLWMIELPDGALPGLPACNRFLQSWNRSQSWPKELSR